MMEVLEFKALLLSINKSIDDAVSFDDFDLKVWTYLYYLTKKIIEEINDSNTFEAIYKIAKKFRIFMKDDDIEKYRDLVIYYLIRNITNIDTSQNVAYPLVNYDDDICPMDIFIQIYNYHHTIDAKNYDVVAAALYIF